MNKGFGPYFPCVFFVCFCTYIGQNPNDLAVRHGVSLIEISCRCSEFAIRSAVWRRMILLCMKIQLDPALGLIKNNFFKNGFECKIFQLLGDVFVFQKRRKLVYGIGKRHFMGM